VTPATPRCPQCWTGKGRWLELAWIGESNLHSFLCVTCGHYWAAPLTFDAAEPGKVLPFGKREAS
jgi:Zn ribbon nucleic-acid-binding protein